jgi:hypothetical protein
LSKSNLTIDEINNLLEIDFEKIITFIIRKIDKYKNEKDNGGDFPKNEKSGNNDKPITIQILPYYKSFMLRYIIEYYFLKFKPDELFEYIKDIRIPQSKKYEKELREIYKKIK